MLSLTRLSSRVAAPIVARQGVAAAATTGAVPARLQHASSSAAARAIHSAAAPRASALATTAPLLHSNTSATASAASSSSSSGAGADASSSGSAVSAQTLAVSALALVGIASAVLLEYVADEHTADVVRKELRAIVQVLGVSAAECEAAAAEIPLTLRPGVARVGTAVAPLGVVLDARELAPYWRRVLASLLDAALVQGAISLAYNLLSRLRPNNRMEVSYPQFLVVSFVLSVLYEAAFLVGWNGQTIGKWLLSIRTCRVDFDELDTPTALKGAVTRALCVGLSGPIDLIPLMWKDRRTERQLLHNVAASTIVISEGDALDDDLD